MSDFKQHLKEKYPNINTDKLFDIIDNEINSIFSPDENAELKFPLKSDIVKSVMFRSLDIYLNDEGN